jgi:hypothetical protein
LLVFAGVILVTSQGWFTYLLRRLHKKSRPG